MVKHWKTFGLLLLLALAAANSFAADNDRGTLIREETLYASAGANSQKLSQVGRGIGHPLHANHLAISRFHPEPAAYPAIGADRLALIGSTVAVHFDGHGPWVLRSHHPVKII